jgi:hypothetical protein
MLQRKLTEYHQTPKNNERKLKDLVKYLFDKKLIKRYRNLRIESEDIRSLDEATQLLTGKFNLQIDQKQLRLLRDRLLSQEMQRLLTELHQLRGMILVEGDWSIDIQPESYVFRRPFVENVTNPPLCEIKLRKNDISTQYKDIIEGLKGSPMRLSILGNVITGISGDSRIVLLNPIAVF